MEEGWGQEVSVEEGEKAGPSPMGHLGRGRRGEGADTDLKLLGTDAS